MYMTTSSRSALSSAFAAVARPSVHTVIEGMCPARVGDDFAVRPRRVGGNSGVAGRQVGITGGVTLVNTALPEVALRNVALLEPRAPMTHLVNQAQNIPSKPDSATSSTVPQQNKQYLEFRRFRDWRPPS
jgi:hypothetical protein